MQLQLAMRETPWSMRTGLYEEKLEERERSSQQYIVVISTVCVAILGASHICNDIQPQTERLRVRPHIS